MAMADEPTEIFDDLYLGLRAGGALRKKRRGEPLTMEEEEALGRWESLAGARKAATIGAFATVVEFAAFTCPPDERERLKAALAEMLVEIFERFELDGDDEQEVERRVH